MKIRESKYPNYLIGVGIAVPIILLSTYVFAIFHISNSEDILVGSVFFGIVILASIILLLMELGWKITYNDDGTFTYRNYFWKSKTYRYADVEPKYISENRTDYYIDDKKILSIAYYITNGNALDKHIKNAKSNKIKSAETDNEPKNKNVCSKQPLMTLGFGLLAFICGALIVMASLIDASTRSRDIWFDYLFTSFGIAAFIVGVYCLMLYFFWQVRYYDETFTYRNWFGLKRTYRYDEVSAAADNPVKTYFYRNGKKILMIRYFAIYPDELLVRIKKANKKKTAEVKVEKSNDVFSDEQAVSESKEKAKYTKLNLYRPLIGFTGVLSLTLARILHNKPMGTIINMLYIFVPIIALIIVMTVFSVNWLITYNDDGTFEYRNIFRRRKTYRYKDIQVRRSKLTIKAYIKDKKVFSIPIIASNRNELEKRIRQELLQE